MKKFLFLPVLALLFCGGCCHNAFDTAKNMILTGEAECAVVRSGEIVAVEKGRGISPLLKLYDEQGALMKDAVVVDKVIGRAAAFITIKGGATEVYGKIMSQDAKALLEEHQIKVSHDLLVPYILNNQRNGLCPLEDSVKGIKEPDAALKAMRQRLKELRRK